MGVQGIEHVIMTRFCFKDEEKKEDKKNKMICLQLFSDVRHVMKRKFVPYVNKILNHNSFQGGVGGFFINTEE